jgi:regulatory protein
MMIWLKRWPMDSASALRSSASAGPEEYIDTFHALAERHWESIRETNVLKKRKKFCDYMLRRGFESNLVYDKVKELENSVQ